MQNCNKQYFTSVSLCKVKSHEGEGHRSDITLGTAKGLTGQQEDPGHDCVKLYSDTQNTELLFLLSLVLFEVKFSKTNWKPFLRTAPEHVGVSAG